MKTRIATASILMLLSFRSLLLADDVPSSGVPKSESAEIPSSTVAPVPEQSPCHWWHRGRCSEDVAEIEGLPIEAPRSGVVITVDTTNNVAYLFRDGELLTKGPAATGSNKLLKRGLKQWLFRTPRGRHKILRKIVDPVWVKPDWAFVEDGKPVPPNDSPKRRVKGKLGRYALDLGDGILIHGTDDPSSLGKKVSHGCIRLGDEMLELVYSSAGVGTEVHIF